MGIKHPQPKSFRDLIRGRRFLVPIFQRPYEWEKEEQVRDLWRDITENDPPYFLGILLLRPLNEEMTEFEVIDGQQRLATLLLLIRAATKTMEQEDSNLANEFQAAYINQKEPGDETPQLTLTLSRRDKEKFQSLLLGTSFKKKSKPKSYSSWNNLDEAFLFLKDEMEKLRQQNGVAGIRDFLTKKVTTLSFIDVQLQTDSDVYLFFETLNVRRLDLTIADIVKNQVCQAAQAQQKSVEDAAAVIDEIAQLLGDGNMKNFLLHYCWAHADGSEPPARKKLMDWYSEKIGRTKDVLKEFLEDLLLAAFYYADFVNPRQCKEPKKKTVFTYLKALGATRCYPLLLQGEETIADTKDFIKLCKAVEILTFRHSTVLKRDAKILEGVYFKLAKSLRTERNLDKVMKELLNQEAMRDDDAFKTSFLKFGSKENQPAKYALWKIEEHIATPKEALLDWDALEVEHVLAKELDWKDKEEYLHRLGNRTLLSGPKNKEGSNKRFEEKKELVFREEKRVEMTKRLGRLKEFTKKTIEKRQREFLENALNIWSPSSLS